MTTGSPFRARYRGPCAAECGVSIEVDDVVVYDDDELVHQQCADGGRDVGRQQPCARCWLVHAGECP